MILCKAPRMTTIASAGSSRSHKIWSRTLNTSIRGSLMLAGLRHGGSGARWQELLSAWSASLLNVLNRKETQKSLGGTRTSIWLTRWLVGRTWSGNQVTNGLLTSRRTPKKLQRTMTLCLRWRPTKKFRRTKMMERASLTVSIESLALSTISMYTTS